MLRAHRERPSCRRDVEHTEKFSPPHVSNPRHRHGETIALWEGARGFQGLVAGDARCPESGQTRARRVDRPQCGFTPVAMMDEQPTSSPVPLSYGRNALTSSSIIRSRTSCFCKSIIRDIRTVP
jgi:hypothetical protein